MEKVGRHIDRFASNPGIDKLGLFTLTLFSFVSGNADMHLKNFSLLTDEKGRIRLAPAYDLVSTKLAMPDDREDLALTLNAKRNDIRRKDFDLFAAYLGISSVARENIFTQFSQKLSPAAALINFSCLSGKYKAMYKDLLVSKYKSVGLTGE